MVALILALVISSAAPPEVTVVFQKHFADRPPEIYVQDQPDGIPRLVRAILGYHVEFGGFSPDTKRLIVFASRPTGKPPRQDVMNPPNRWRDLRLLDLDTGKLSRFDAEERSYGTAIWSPDGRYLATKSVPSPEDWVNEGAEPRVDVWDLRTHARVEIVPGELDPAQIKAVRESWIMWSPNSRSVFIGDQFKRFAVPVNGGRLKRLSLEGPPYVSFDSMYPQAFTLSPDGKYVALNPSWYQASGALHVKKVGGKEFTIKLNEYQTDNVIWSDDSRKAALIAYTTTGLSDEAPIYDEDVRLYSVDVVKRAPKTLAKYVFAAGNNSNGSVRVVGWSPNSDWIYVVEDDGKGRQDVVAYQWAGNGKRMLGQFETEDPLHAIARR